MYLIYISVALVLEDNMKKRVFVSIIILVTIGVLAGCSKHESEKKGSTLENQDQSTNQTLELDWMAILYEQQPPNDTIIKKIEEKTNTNLNIIWVPDAIKKDRFNAALASGNMPKVVTIPELDSSSVLNALKSGMFWDIGPYLKEFPNLSKMNETILNNISIEGKIYGIYRERPVSRQGVVIRSDWLENLGLTMPKTVNDLYEIAKAFTYDDPDQNGKDDTIGITDRNDLVYGVFKTLASYMGTPNEWGIVNGKLIPDFQTKEYMNTMDFMKRLYDEKLINYNFTITSKTQQQALFTSGKAGIYIGNMVDGISMRNRAKKINPNFSVDITNRIKGPKGKEHVWAGDGYGGMFSIPKSSVKTEKEVKEILAFFDRSIDQDVAALYKIGLEGVHYKKIGDGKFEQINENKSLINRNVRPLNSLVSLDNDYFKNTGDPLRVKFDRLVKDNESIAVTNPTEGLFSSSFLEHGTELRKIIDDATYKYIIGEISKAGFRNEVKKWHRNGGTKIIEEYNAEYKKKQ